MSGRRFEEAGFRGMMRVWSGRARGKHRGCSAVGSAGTVRRWEASGPAESTGVVRRCRLVVVRGEILSAWAYVLRASLKVQSSFDIWDLVGFMPLAQRQLDRWIYSMALAPIMMRIVGCTGKLCGYLPGLLLNMLENG